MNIDTISGKIVSAHGGKETEQNWEKIDTLYKEFSSSLQSSTPEEVIQGVKKFKEVLQSSVRRNN